MARKPKPSTTNERVVDASSSGSRAADLAPPGAGALERNVLDEILTLQLVVAWGELELDGDGDEELSA
jgi:hypothetical protein